jgi:hypothetical protein
MTDEKKTEQNTENLTMLMEFIEAIDDIKAVCGAVTVLSLEDFTSENWEGLQACMQANIEMLDLLRTNMSMGSKLIGNEAVLSHIEAVVTAD